MIKTQSFIVYVALAAMFFASDSVTFSQTNPDRSLPPKLNDFVVASDESLQLQTKMTVSDVQEVVEKNAILKGVIEDLQLERLELLQQDKTEKGNALRSSIWPSATIPVYWENPEAVPDEERQWVRDAVEQTWMQHSGLKFTEWGKATGSSRGIRIRIADEGPHCKRLGKHLDGMPDGMVLNFSFQTWCNACGVDRKGSIEKIAVHEFGHAIGLAHEQNRRDAPDWCKLERQGSDGDWYVTIYDPQSIMNYCNPEWNNSGLLSNLDIRTVQVLYGQPAAEEPPSDDEKKRR